MPSLPQPTHTAIWKKAPRPARVTLLRTGKELPFRYEEETLTVELPTELRDDSQVHVVRVEWTP